MRRLWCISLVVTFILTITKVNAQGPQDLCSMFMPLLQDAGLNEYEPDTPKPLTKTLRAKAGTVNGNAATVRGLLEFDLSTFGANITIDSAFLRLYSAESSAGNRHHWDDGPNDATLYRVTEDWSDQTATWNDAPAYSAANATLVPATTDSLANMKIDVTALVQDMISSPNNSHGFFLRLNDESPYRGLIFASSDNAFAGVHPKLEIIYRCDDLIGTQDVKSEQTFNLIQNNKTLQLSTSETISEVVVYDLLGRQMLTMNPMQPNLNIATSEWNDGIYFITVLLSNGDAVTEKVVLNH